MWGVVVIKFDRLGSAIVQFDDVSERVLGGKGILGIKISKE